MKYVVLVPDGAADYPIDELNGKTPLEAARTPNMDRLAAEGISGLVQVIPPIRHPGSDVGNLELFGYDSCRHYSGRAPLEAASMGVALGDTDIAFRCNLITREGDTLVDYSAGHISTEEAGELIEHIAGKLQNELIKFYPGVGYRHLMVYADGPSQLDSFPPHDIMGKSITAHLPRGDQQNVIRQIMVDAEPLLVDTEVNKKRKKEGKSPANAIWLWGSGRALQLQSILSKYGVTGGVISAVDLVRGIGVSAGLKVIDVPGITGYLDTNYAGKADAALRVLQNDDFVYVHVEAPDEAGHNADVEGKKRALEDFDEKIVGRIIAGLSNLDEPVRVLMAPDHRTPIVLRTHSREPVPFVLWGKDIEADTVLSYSEAAAESGSTVVEKGHQLMDLLMASK